jgi:hypothetical protein
MTFTETGKQRYALHQARHPPGLFCVALPTEAEAWIRWGGNCVAWLIAALRSAATDTTSRDTHLARHGHPHVQRFDHEPVDCPHRSCSLFWPWGRLSLDEPRADDAGSEFCRLGF